MVFCVNHEYVSKYFMVNNIHSKNFIGWIQAVVGGGSHETIPLDKKSMFGNKHTEFVDHTTIYDVFQKYQIVSSKKVDSDLT